MYDLMCLGYLKAIVCIGSDHVSGRRFMKGCKHHRENCVSFTYKFSCCLFHRLDLLLVQK
jgi:hypothetical protein